jgi:hypothetical protein
MPIKKLHTNIMPLPCAKSYSLLLPRAYFKHLNVRLYDVHFSTFQVLRTFEMLLNLQSRKGDGIITYSTFLTS